MDDVLTQRADATPDVSVAFNWPAVRERCAERGARTNVECAVALGLSPRTLDRLRLDPEGGLLRVALQVRRKTGLSLDELFPAVDSSRLAA